MNPSDSTNGSLTKDLLVYISILGLAGLQIILAYRHAEGVQLLVRLLIVAVIQASLAVMFFMHLRDERRSLRLALIPATLFVLFMMNMIWSDSYRLIHMRAFPK